MSTLEERVRARITELREIEQAATERPWLSHEMSMLYVGKGTPGSLSEIVYASVVARNLLPGVLDAAEQILDLHAPLHRPGGLVTICASCDTGLTTFPCPTVLAVASMVGVSVDE